MTAKNSETQKNLDPNPAEEGSLEAMSAQNADLRARIQEGRRRAHDDQASMEQWAGSGYSSTQGEDPSAIKLLPHEEE